MSIKHSIARKKRWEKIPEEQRTEIARATALSRWNNATKKERKTAGKLMAIGRKKSLLQVD